MAEIIESGHGQEFLFGGELETISLDTVTLISGQNIVAGTVLGQIFTATIDRAAATGNGVISAVTAGANMQTGRYTATFLGATSAIMTDPTGRYLGTLTVGTEFVCDDLKVTVSDGATDFDSNDIVYWDVTSKYSLHNNAGTDGSQFAAAIAFNDCDATSADSNCLVVNRYQQVVKDKLTWKTGITAANKAAAIANLAKKLIIMREAA